MQDEEQFHGFQEVEIPEARNLLSSPGLLDTESESESVEPEKTRSEEESNQDEYGGLRGKKRKKFMKLKKMGKLSAAAEAYHAGKFTNIR